MTSSLVMDVEACAEKRSDDLFWFENRKLGRHAPERLWDRNRYLFRRYCSDVARNGFTSLQGAFQVAAYGISRHLAGLFKSLTVGANLRDGGNKNVEAAFRHGFEQRCVAVFHEVSLLL
jgi:hypothetical protein